MIDFHELKHTIQQLILQSSESIPGSHSYGGSGIYLLYVDNFSDEKIIPFYIGKATNLQRRFRNHLNDIKALMQYSYAQYHNEFFWGAVGHKNRFEGKYRPCKIFKYLMDHQCSLDDIKMIALEKCEPEHLDQREQYYLDLYLPSFFGFNQIATVTEQFAYRQDLVKKKAIIAKDFEHFQMYMEFGYSTFNYLHAFSGFGSQELDISVNRLLSNHLWPSPQELFSYTHCRFHEYQGLYNQAILAMDEKFADKIHNIFNKCGLKSFSREKEVLELFTNHYYTPVVDIVNENYVYLEYYFNRNKKSRECGELLKNLYFSHANDIKAICEPVERAFALYAEGRNQALQQSRFSLIFPKLPY